MLEHLKEQVYNANMGLVKHNLVVLTWGNVSGIDRESGLVVIKPSGVDYDRLKVSDMVVVDLEGNVVEGKLRPSSDTPTHVCLYKSFPTVEGIVHTHSTYATSWAQACRPVPVFGTTHSDTFHGMVPCTRILTKKEVETDYEANTGLVISETLKGTDPLHMPGILVANHGPFSWGVSPSDALQNAIILEETAKMAFFTVSLGQVKEIQKYLLDKHFLRKHGPGSYYGQKSK